MTSASDTLTTDTNTHFKGAPQKQPQIKSITMTSNILAQHKAFTDTKLPAPLKPLTEVDVLSTHSLMRHPGTSDRENIPRQHTKKPLLPLEHQFPLSRDYQYKRDNFLSEQGQIAGSVAAGSSTSGGGRYDDQDEIKEITPVINGSETAQQVPNFYASSGDTPMLLSKKKAPKKRTALSSKEVNVLLLHVSRTGDYNSLRSLTRSPKLDVNLVDDEGRSALMFSCMGGHVECVELLLERGALIHLSDYSGRTCLHWAARYGHGTICEKLLYAGADIHAEDYQGKTPLHLSCTQASTEALCVLLHWRRVASSAPIANNCADVNCQDDDKMTPLMWACINGNEPHMHLLLRYLADPFMQDCEGKTALHWCASNPHVHCALVLLRNIPQIVNIKDKYGRTAMHFACDEGNVALLYALAVSSPEVINQVDDIGRTPLHWASICGKSPIAKLLCEFGARQIQDKYMATPLHYACQQDYIDVCIVLLRKGAAVDVGDENGRTAMMWAAIQGHTDCVRFLLDAGADAYKKDSAELTALHLAASGGHTATCLLLLKHVQNEFEDLQYVNSLDSQLQTPLFKASQNGHTETLLALIGEGADVLAEDEAGRLCTHLCAASGYMDCLDILFREGSSLARADRKGATPLHEAAFHGRAEILLYVLVETNSLNSMDEEAVKISCRDCNGVTPLHWAAVNGHLPSVRVLVEHGADLNAMVADDDMDTPLDYAYLNNNVECAQYLIEKGALTIEEIKARKATIIQRAWKNRMKRLQ
ncbi:hypothetical protein MP638_006731 [Amoeboaphelidium occidentale]|nr:hypothetical protein MP638_006731 [Amoeboaphelidium occidentale]